MSAIQENLLRMRIVHAVFLATWFLFVFVVYALKPAERQVASPLVVALVIVACSDIAIALTFRARQIAPALEVLRTNREDASAMTQWRSATILSFCFAEGVTLFGLALKFLGARWSVAGIFFAGGLLLLIAWTPRLDLPAR